MRTCIKAEKRVVSLTMCGETCRRILHTHAAVLDSFRRKDATECISFARCFFGTAGVCSNGIPGIESASGDYCCPATCRACDGDNCYLDGLFCCGDDIEESGVLCDDSEEAPCIIDIGKLNLSTLVAPKRTPWYPPFESRVGSAVLTRPALDSVENDTTFLTTKVFACVCLNWPSPFVQTLMMSPPFVCVDCRLQMAVSPPTLPPALPPAPPSTSTRPPPAGTTTVWLWTSTVTGTSTATSTSGVTHSPPQPRLSWRNSTEKNR